MFKFTLRELQKKETIEQGHFDNLKIKTGNTRVWLSRLTIEDGETCNNKVTVERRDKLGNWITIEQYEAT
jgi:hypothetical protein